MSETTDESGTIYRDFLTEGLYAIEEKKAPEGYLLDENPIKEIFIYATDDNKQYVVTFVNKKKPAIEITKVDAETPTIKLDSVTHEVTIEFGQAYKIELTNTPKSPIYIQKVDEKGEPLSGAKFKVT